MSQRLTESPCTSDRDAGDREVLATITVAPLTADADRHTVVSVDAARPAAISRHGVVPLGLNRPARQR